MAGAYAGHGPGAQRVDAAGGCGAARGHGWRAARSPAAAQESSHLLGIDLGLCGLATVESLQREGVPKDEGQTLRSAEVREPVPGEETGNGHTQTVPRRRKGLQTWCRSGLHLAVEQDGPVMVHDTDLPTAGMPIDPTGKGGVVRVASPEVFSSFMRDFFPSAAYHWGMGRGRPQSLSKACRRRLPVIRNSLCSA